jgi:hypothetical protein
MARKAKATRNKRTEKELRTLRQRLDALIARAKRTERQVARAYAKQRQALRARQAKAKLALQRLRRQSAAAAPPLKSGLQRAWTELNAAVKEAATRFRGSS